MPKSSLGGKDKKTLAGAEAEGEAGNAAPLVAVPELARARRESLSNTSQHVFPVTRFVAAFLFLSLLP